MLRFMRARRFTTSWQAWAPDSMIMRTNLNVAETVSMSKAASAVDCLSRNADA